MRASKLSPTDVADQLRNDILAGPSPAGLRLTEQDLCRRFAVGRGRAREAIHQLARQGLLVIRANRGATVAADAPQAVRDLIIPIRRTVEVYALGVIFDALDDATFARWEAVLEAMRVACEGEDRHAVAEADIAFHRVILERADQPDLLVIWETLLGRIHSHFLRVQWRQPRLLDVYDEHRALLDAFRAGDRAAAVRLLTEKIE